jgi:putative serine/threonine protein kinase
MFRYLTKGKRGKIYVQGSIAIKKSLSKRVKNESSWLKILNKYKIGPKLIEVKKDYFKYEFIKGEFILDYFKSNNPLPVIINILKQCRTMDKLNVNKLEMHNPYKHIIIRNKKPVMIDFERAYKTEKPKNVTQFCQFIMSRKVQEILKWGINKKELITLLRKYKKNQTEKNFNEIISYFKTLHKKLRFSL